MSDTDFQIKKEEMKRAYDEKMARNWIRITDLMLKEMLDEEGYPTEAALEIIELWPFERTLGWFDFIKDLWAYTDWGWRENEEPHEYRKNTMVRRFKISTAGWSGNELLIRHMEKNVAVWHTTWVQSRRGGHYIFECVIGDENV
jgi:hypothetical protein